MAENLDLDALLLQEQMSDVVAWTALHQPTPTVILDLGAGTGTGTVGLAHTYPDAALIAVDYSEFMLDRLAARITELNLSDRVSAQQVDLDAGWPKLDSADLVWAALSMHHMANPVAVFENIAKTLSAHGLLVIVEMDGWPRYLPYDLGFGAPGFEERCHAAVGEGGWNSYPDWAIAIQEAGLTMVEQRAFDYESLPGQQDQDLISRAAQIFLAKVRASHAENLSGDDLAILDQLLDPQGAQFLGHRTDLSVRAKRLAWAARKN